MQAWVDKYSTEFAEAVIFPPVNRGEYPLPGNNEGESLYYLDLKLFNGKFSQEVRDDYEAHADFQTQENNWFNGGR